MPEGVQYPVIPPGVVLVAVGAEYLVLVGDAIGAEVSPVLNMPEEGSSAAGWASSIDPCLRHLTFQCGV